MTTDTLDMFKKALTSIGVNVLFLKEPFENISKADYGFRELLFGAASYEPYLDSLRKNTDPHTFQLTKDELDSFYISATATEALYNEYAFRYLLIGPFLFQPVTTAQFHDKVSTFSLTPDATRSLLEFYHRIPLIQSYDFLRAILQPYLNLLWGEDFLFRETTLGYPTLLLKQREDYNFDSMDTPAIKIIEERYQAEARMLKALCSGKTEDTLRYRHQFVQYRIVPRTADPVRNKKNLLIVENTLFRKTVEAAKVHPYHIDNLSAQFAIQIENSTTVAQLESLAHTMIRKYCMLVNNYSRRGNSALVQFTLDYIESHYAAPLSLDKIAKELSVTNGYLSGLFKKETGQTITEFINQTRIRQSLSYLNTTHLPVHDIAERCGFSDPNYYTRIFKKILGLTPKEYRNQINRQPSSPPSS